MCSDHGQDGPESAFCFSKSANPRLSCNHRHDSRFGIAQYRRQNDCLHGRHNYGSVGSGSGENQVRTVAYKSLLVQTEPKLLEVDPADDLGT
jgi:hypothetical protein